MELDGVGCAMEGWMSGMWWLGPVNGVLVTLLLVGLVVLVFVAIYKIYKGEKG